MRDRYGQRMKRVRKNLRKWKENGKRANGWETKKGKRRANKYKTIEFCNELKFYNAQFSNLCLKQPPPQIYGNNFVCVNAL